MDQSLPVLPYYVSIAIAILAPIAVAGNALVLAAIWRNTSLRTPCYILLAGLAFTDFSTGLITQPIYVSIDFFHLTEAQRPIMLAIANGCTMFFTSNTLLILTLLSVERWLQMTQRSSLLTVRRASIIVVFQLFIATPGTVFRVLYNIKESNGLTANIFALSILLFCLFVTSVSYINVFRIIRRHQHQIEANDSAHNFGQPAINFAKYKKSVFSVLYILAVFYFSYLPICTALVLLQISNNQNFTFKFFDISMLFLFLSSSLNPFLYLWRMKDIRNEVTRLLKEILKKE